MKNATKPYENFTDKNGNVYTFDNYMDFATFWFNLSYRYAKATFPTFHKLQNCAANSREARKAAY